jgi:hypothetical protein
MWAPGRRSQARRLHPAEGGRPGWAWCGGSWDPTASSGVFSVDGGGEDAVMVALGCAEQSHLRCCCHGGRQRVRLICLGWWVVAKTVRMARWAATCGGGVDLSGVTIVNKDGGGLDHLRLCCQLVAWGLLARLNKDGGPMVHLAQGRRSARCLSSLIWLDCRVSEGSTDELPWVSYS